MLLLQVELPANSKIEYKYVILEEQVLFFAKFESSTQYQTKSARLHIIHS